MGSRALEGVDQTTTCARGRRLDLASFYSLMAETCFTLAGLWWTVVDKHPEWKRDRRRRKLTGDPQVNKSTPS